MSRSTQWVALLLALTVGAAIPAPTFARQDASPTAAADCAAPALPPGTPTPMEEMGSPQGTPAGAEDEIAMGTPATYEDVVELAETAEAATLPATSATPAGTSADAATTDRVIAAVENVVACLNAGEALAFAALVTPNYLRSEFGIDNPYDVPLFLEGFPPQELRSAGDVQTHPDGRLSADITTVLGGTQVDRFRVFFVAADGDLLVDEERSLPVVGADVEVEVALLDFAFDLSQETAPAGALVAFTVTNQGKYPHEFAVVRLPEGVTVERVLEDSSLEERVQFVGGAYAEPGDVGYLGLEGLEPGTYTIVCFVDVPEGVPHVVRGMVAEFTVA